MQYNKKIFLILLSFINLFLSPYLIQADTSPQRPVGFQLIGEASSNDWVEFNTDRNKLAVITTVSLDGFPALGKAIRVYSINTDLKPQRLLFELEAKDVWITEFRWVGSSLVYTTIEGFEKPEQVWGWFTSLRRSSDLASVPKHVKLRQWPSPITSDLEEAYLFEPGQARLLPLGNNKLLIINPLSSRNETKAQLEQTYSEEQVCKMFSIPQDKLISSFTVRMLNPGNRWWGSHGDFIPLFVSKDSKKIVAMVSSGYPWRGRSKYNVPFVITIDLQTGKINAITPDSELHGLRSGRDLRYFEPGNPMPIEGGSKIVFNLNMVDTINDVIAYFAYYDLDGNKIKEVAILQQDLKRAGVPLGLLLTWTPDGRKVLLQSEDGIWLVDIEKWTGKKIANNIWVDGVFQWIGDELLLVQARKMIGKKVDPQPSQAKKTWGVLSLSDAV